MTVTTRPKSQAQARGSNGETIHPLCNGDHLDAAEFLRRYHAMPGVKKAELIEGVVYMPSPVSTDNHGTPHGLMATWLGMYWFDTPGVSLGNDSTVELDGANVVQPDVFLFIEPSRGGRTTNDGGYVVGGPELACEVSASSVSIDRNAKMTAYRRNGVREYVLWRVLDGAIDWFALRGRRYVPLPVGEDGIVRSVVFPGLWLDVQAVLNGDRRRVRDVLFQGIASAEHAAFVARLQAAFEENGQ